MAGEMRRAAEAWECSASKQHEARARRICRRSAYTIGDAGLRAEEMTKLVPPAYIIRRVRIQGNQHALTPS